MLLFWFWWITNMPLVSRERTSELMWQSEATFWASRYVSWTRRCTSREMIAFSICSSREKSSSIATDLDVVPTTRPGQPYPGSPR